RRERSRRGGSDRRAARDHQRRHRRPGAARHHPHRHAGDTGEGLEGDSGSPGRSRMKNFAFHRPQSVADALSLLRADDSAKLLSGGQSLLPVMKLDLAQPSGLVSLSRITDLKGVRSDGNDLVIGAFTTHDEVASSAEVKKRIPGLAGLASGIGDAQIRNRGTIGGSLAHADPSADYPAGVLALGATIVTDRRSIAADDFFTGLFSSALAPDEIITAVRFPVPERAAYGKFPHPASKYAVVGVFVAKTAGGVRVAVTGAGS